MLERRKVRLQDAFWFQEGPGVRSWQFRSSGIKLLNVANIRKGGSLDLSVSSRYLDEEEVKEKYCHFLVDEGDLVIASSGISFDIDGLLRTRAAFVKAEHLPLCMNTSTIRFKSKDNISSLRFLKYWFNSAEFRKQISIGVTGSAQQNFGPMQLKNTWISLPSIGEQQRIAAILEKADRLRRLRRYARNLSDTLIQSVFLEMFGDPARNVRGYPWVRFGDVCDSRLGKMLDSKQQTGKHIRSYVRNVNIQWDNISLDDLQEMDFDEEDREKYKLLPGDVLICEGGEVGRAAIWKCQMEEFYFQKALHRVRPDQSKITSEYIVWLMFCLAKLGGLVESTSQATISHLTGIKLKAMNIPLPPISEQHHFANAVIKFNELQDQLSEAERQVEQLFQSLLHRAFDGGNGSGSI